MEKLRGSGPTRNVKLSASRESEGSSSASRGISTTSRTVRDPRAEQRIASATKGSSSSKKHHSSSGSSSHISSRGGSSSGHTSGSDGSNKNGKTHAGRGKRKEKEKMQEARARDSVGGDFGTGTRLESFPAPADLGEPDGGMVTPMQSGDLGHGWPGTGSAHDGGLSATTLTPSTLSGGRNAAPGPTFGDRRPSLSVSTSPELESGGYGTPAQLYRNAITTEGPSSTVAEDESITAISSSDSFSESYYSPPKPIDIPAHSGGAVPASISGHHYYNDNPTATAAAAAGYYSPSSSSYAPTSPLLPPPPPEYRSETATGMEIGTAEDAGHDDVPGYGGLRHTIVYGGGVCLACLASGGGGSYGPNVPPEQRFRR